MNQAANGKKWLIIVHPEYPVMSHTRRNSRHMQIEQKNSGRKKLIFFDGTHTQQPTHTRLLIKAHKRDTGNDSESACLFSPCCGVVRIRSSSICPKEFRLRERERANQKHTYALTTPVAERTSSDAQRRVSAAHPGWHFMFLHIHAYDSGL